MTRIVRALVVAGLLAGTGAWAADDAVVYEIEVSLDPSAHRLQGRERIRWTNTTAAATSELWLHLYLNAFANGRTTFMRELGPYSLHNRTTTAMEWGWIQITRLQTRDRGDLLPHLEFLRPDDANPNDFTVARVVLPGEVLPGSSVELELDFEAQLPRVVARTGFAGDFHFAGQWFPKLGVFEDEGVRGRTEPGWNCHQFHATSEFYSDFGTYRVEITVPDDWIVGATGVEVARSSSDVGEQRVVFQARGVHDFAWCAAPASSMTVIEAEFDPERDVPTPWLERARTLLGRSAAELELPPVHLRLLVPRTQTQLASRMLRAARLGIAWYGLFYGPYPAPQLTIVSPPPTAEEAGGMEYPTLITTGASRALTFPLLRRVPWIEMVTVHEFGHQYFYGLIASNEFEEAWLDEGLNSYAEISCLEAIAVDGLVPELGHTSPWTLERSRFAARTLPVTVDRRAWEFRRRSDYFSASYTKTAIALRTLEGLVGAEVLARALHAYADRFRYDHPSGDDLFAVIEEVADQDLSWFFDQALRGDAVADWAVLDVRHRRRRPTEGFAWHESGWQRADSSQPADAPPWTVTVDLGRRGSFVGPVEVELRYADGTRERRQWADAARWTRWTLPSQQRLIQVVVDPDGVWALEVRRHDNYWRSEPNVDTSRRARWWARQALQLLDLIRLPWS